MGRKGTATNSHTSDLHDIRITKFATHSSINWTLFSMQRKKACLGGTNATEERPCQARYARSRLVFFATDIIGKLEVDLPKIASSPELAIKRENSTDHNCSSFPSTCSQLSPILPTSPLFVRCSSDSVDKTSQSFVRCKFDSSSMSSDSNSDSA